MTRMTGTLRRHPRVAGLALLVLLVVVIRLVLAGEGQGPLWTVIWTSDNSPGGKGTLEVVSSSRASGTVSVGIDGRQQSLKLAQGTATVTLPNGVDHRLAPPNGTRLLVINEAPAPNAISGAATLTSSTTSMSLAASITANLGGSSGDVPAATASTRAFDTSVRQPPVAKPAARLDWRQLIRGRVIIGTPRVLTDDLVVTSADYPSCSSSDYAGLQGCVARKAADANQPDPLAGDPGPLLPAEAHTALTDAIVQRYDGDVLVGTAGNVGGVPTVATNTSGIVPAWLGLPLDQAGQGIVDWFTHQWQAMTNPGGDQTLVVHANGTVDSQPAGGGLTDVLTGRQSPPSGGTLVNAVTSAGTSAVGQISDDLGVANGIASTVEATARAAFLELLAESASSISTEFGIAGAEASFFHGLINLAQGNYWGAAGDAVTGLLTIGTLSFVADFAAVGSMFGPVGTILGAALGLGLSLFLPGYFGCLVQGKSAADCRDSVWAPYKRWLDNLESIFSDIYAPDIYVENHTGQPQPIQVRLSPLGTHDVNPAWDHGLWQGTVSPDGTLEVGGADQTHLHYETLTAGDWQTGSGWVIPRAAFEGWARQVLPEYGFSPAAVEGFVTTWQGLETGPGRIAIYPQAQALIDRVQPIEVQPASATVQRVWFLVAPAQGDAALAAPAIPAKTPSGIEVEEWGMLFARGAMVGATP